MSAGDSIACWKSWWDRLFGTFKESEHFALHCGFPGRQEEHLQKMLLFKNVYRDQAAGSKPPSRP
ncbi:hypothetical protein [Vogesella sp. LIG4]|uniref:hypothetical protein n=1 Tax=Vogesella sp. LIG4 TaxID=1192162 RepID=UPI000B5AE8DD|nr:hypothetical protein [Vogesella sp. LIG4]